MPQVKQLQELNAAGQAAKNETTGCEFFIQWHLTENCNLRCRHCYQIEGMRNMELSLHEAEDVIDEASGMLESWAETYGIGFSPSFNITGGEPFLRADLFEILGAIKARGFGIFLLTNGTLIDRNRAKALSDTGIDGVQVSIEGPPEIHDSIRGKGSFGASVEGIKNLLDAGLRVTLNATLSKINAHHMPEVLNIASGLGVQRAGFSRLVPSGRGLSLIGEMLSPEEVKGLYGFLLSRKIEGLEIVTGDPVASMMAAGEKDSGKSMCSTATGGCAAGISGLTILSDGSITPCRRLHIPIGNVRSDSLREVWATSPVLENLRDKSRYAGRCGRCPRWSGCRGCRAIAYAYSLSKGEGDFLSEDPQCFIED
jgi:MoaA/NifB/PqqE/SkfB family radical SAM enzyme